MFNIFKWKKIPLSVAATSIKCLSDIDVDILARGREPSMSKEFLITPIESLDNLIGIIDRSLETLSFPNRSDFKVISLENKRVYLSEFINIADYENLTNYLKELITKSSLFLETYELLESSTSKTMEEERTLRVYRFLYSALISLAEQLNGVCKKYSTNK